MSKTTLYLRKDKAVEGKLPIELRYNHKKGRAFYWTGIRLYPCSFNEESQRAIFINKVAAKKSGIPFEKLPTEREIISINERLNRLLVEIKRIESGYIESGEYFTADTVIKSLRDLINGKIESSKQDKELITDYITKYIDSKPTDKTKASLVVYNTLVRHLKSFEITGKSISFNDMSLSFLNSFKDFLLGKGLLNSTVEKQISTLTKFLKMAIDEGYSINPNCTKYKKLKKNYDKVFALSESERDLIENYDFSNNKRLDQVRDLFIFSCYTALRFSDCIGLNWINIKDGYIELTVKKTKEKHIVPLVETSSRILSKYNEKVYPLPRISNQKANKYIKEVAEIVGLTDLMELVKFNGQNKKVSSIRKCDRLSIHCGRKTCITLGLVKGIPVQTMMQISGHTDFNSFKRYVAISEEVKRNALVAAFGKPIQLHNQTLKAV